MVFSRSSCKVNGAPLAIFIRIEISKIDDAKIGAGASRYLLSDIMKAAM
jgi:hypothetical protein